MNNYKSDFIDFCLENNVLQFGEFKLKSGRISPYFFNFGLFKTGEALSRLGNYYAEAIVESNVKFDVLFGPAYKGIPLVSVVTAKLYENHNINCEYAYNRKEAKKHGEGGNIVGAELKGNVLIVDDVISAGTASREAAEIIHRNNAKVSGIAISLDRMEKGLGENSAVQEVEQQLSINVINVVNLADIISYLESKQTEPVKLETIQRYRETYGA